MMKKYQSKMVIFGVICMAINIALARTSTGSVTCIAKTKGGPRLTVLYSFNLSPECDPDIEDKAIDGSVTL